jgi:hypothetical protein
MNKITFLILFLILSMSTYAQTPPPNDDCSGAIGLTVGAISSICAPIIGTNVDATASELADATIPNPGCASYNGDDVWYSLIVPASGSVTVETYEDDLTITDGGLAIYSGNCNPNGLVLLACNDDSGIITNENFERVIIHGRMPGETLFVRVWAYSNSEVGTFNICATEITAAASTTNDDCVDAIDLTIGVTCTSIIGTNIGATDSENADPTIPDPGCASYLGADVWFKVTVPASGDLAVETYEDDLSITDGGMAIYSGSCNPSGLTLIDCNDDNGVITNESFERLEILGRTPGEVLFVRIYTFDNLESGTFNICATELNAVVSTEQFNIDSFNIYPNPTKNTINIELNNLPLDDVEINIYSIQGKLVLNSLVIESNTILDVSKLSKGLYFVELNNQDQKSIQKLIVE